MFIEPTNASLAIAVVVNPHVMVNDLFDDMEAEGQITLALHCRERVAAGVPIVDVVEYAIVVLQKAMLMQAVERVVGELTV